MISIDQTPDSFSIQKDLLTPEPPSIHSALPPPSYHSYARSPRSAPILTPESNNQTNNEDYEPSGDFLLWSQWEDTDSDEASPVIKRKCLSNLDKNVTQIIPDTQSQ